MRRGYLFAVVCLLPVMGGSAWAGGPTREELEIRPSGPVRLPGKRAELPTFAGDAARQGERRYNYGRYEYVPVYYGDYWFDGYWGGCGFAPDPYGAPALCGPRFEWGPLDRHRFVGPVPIRLLNRWSYETRRAAHAR